MERKRQIVVLETTEGTAYTERVLKEVWEHRIKENFPHYRLLCCKIIKEKA